MVDVVGWQGMARNGGEWQAPKAIIDVRQQRSLDNRRSGVQGWLGAGGEVLVVGGQGCGAGWGEVLVVGGQGCGAG